MMKNSLLFVFALLFSFNANADTRDFLNKVKDNNIPAVISLLEEGEDVNGENEQGNTALHYAVAMNNPEMTKLLLDKGADLGHRNKKGWTPLSISQKKNVAAVSIVIKEYQQEKLGINNTAEQTSEVASVLSDMKAKVVAAGEKVSDVASNTASKVVSAVKGVMETKPAIEEKQEKVNTEIEEVKKEIKEKTVVSIEKTEEIKEQLSKVETEVVEVKEVVQKINENVQKEIETPKIVEKDTGVKELQPIPEEDVKKYLSNMEKKVEEKVVIEQEKPQPQENKVVAEENIDIEKKAEAITNVSPLSEQISLGDEEIIYCLNYLALQGEQKHLTSAAAYFAKESGVSRQRHDVAIFASNKYFENASEEDIKKRADECSKIITPSLAEKQNQIIRGINKSMGY